MLDLNIVSLNDVPKSTFAAAAAKPLNGIDPLSNFAFVTAAFAIFAVVTLTSAIFAVVTLASAILTVLASAAISAARIGRRLKSLQSLASAAISAARIVPSKILQSLQHHLQ
jgi:hypothetical protein